MQRNSRSKGAGCGIYDAPRMELIRFTSSDVIATSPTDLNSDKVGTYNSRGDSYYNDIFTS